MWELAVRCGIKNYPEAVVLLLHVLCWHSAKHRNTCHPALLSTRSRSGRSQMHGDWADPVSLILILMHGDTESGNSSGWQSWERSIPLDSNPWTSSIVLILQLHLIFRDWWLPGDYTLRQRERETVCVCEERDRHLRQTEREREREQKKERAWKIIQYLQMTYDPSWQSIHQVPSILSCPHYPEEVNDSKLPKYWRLYQNWLFEVLLLTY